jgi:hypothetical protein
MNTIMALWTEIFYQCLAGKPYQPAMFMVALHLLFGKSSHRGVKYPLAKDFSYSAGLMRNLELPWNKHKLVDNTFVAHPTKVKMPEDYARNIFEPQ